MHFYLPLLLLISLNSWASAQVQENGEGADLVAQLDSLRATAQESPEAYLQLGNQLFESGAEGYALLAYERGLRISPGNDALENNLRYVRGELGIDRPTISDFFGVRWWRNLGAFIGVSTARYLALLCWILAIAGATIWYLRREAMTEARRFALLPVSGLLLALALFFYLLAGSRLANLDYDREAVLVAERTTLRVAPGADATVEQELGEGLKVEILDRFDAYVKIALLSGRQGWVPAENLAVI